jgi:amino acid adenylation domain-containing protein
VLSYRGGAVSVALGEELSRELKEVARREGATLFMVLLAAFKTLLFRYTGQRDLVVGTAEAGRVRAELEPIIGLFVNTLALRTELGGEQSFRELLQLVRETALNAYAHRELPFDTLVEHLQPDRSLSHHPLFQVMFVVQNAPAVPINVPGLTASLLPHRTVAAKFDLNFHLGETPAGIAGQLYYNRDLFDTATAERLIGHYRQLLRSVLADLNQPIARLQLLPAEEQKKMFGWSRTKTEELDHRCIHRQFVEQAEKTPNAPAVVCLDQQLSFAELNSRANQLAYYLRWKGVRTETVVGIHLLPSIDAIVALLGILKAGGAYVGLDPTLPGERLNFMVDDANVSLVLTSSEIPAWFSTGNVAFVALDTISEGLANENTDNPDIHIAWENLAYVIYTSGSTGRPKGVAGAHRQLAAYLNAILDRLHFVPGSSFTMHQALSIDAPVTQYLVTLCRGGVLHIIPHYLATDPDALGKYFQLHRIDYFKCAPSHLAALHASEWPEQIMPRRLLLIGGEAAHADWVASVQQLAPACAIVNHYGPTETTVGVMTYRFSSASEVQGPTLPLGRPLPNAEIYLLDASLNPVPVGVAGEILIGGETLSRGYLNRPELTALKFIPNPFGTEPGARLYKTGDLGRYLVDGNVEFLGRIDQQVKVRGFRVELGEIEAVLMDHSSVQAAAVSKWEQTPGAESLVAYVVASGPTPELHGELVQFLRAKLPDYMVPSVFKFLDALPHTAQGKIDRRLLPAPDVWYSELRRDFVAPRTPTEESVAEVWIQLLGLPRVSVFDNFFDLGGHSLLATRLLSRLRQNLSIELSLRTIFQEPTIAGLSRMIDHLAENEVAMVAAAPSVVPVARQERRTKLSELRKNMR